MTPANARFQLILTAISSAECVWLAPQSALSATVTQANGDPIPSKDKICIDPSTHTTGGLAAVFASATCTPAGKTDIGAPCNTVETCAAEKARVLSSGVVCETTWLHGVNDDACAIDPQKGEVIGLDPWNDVQTSYNTFKPLPCNVTFSIVSRGTAMFHDAFGWYNALPGHAPDPSDLHVMLGCGSQVGDTASLDVRNEPAYKGGEIGYFLLTPEGRDQKKFCAAGDCCASLDRYNSGVGYAYFTEPGYNPEGLLSGKPYVHFVAYDSRLTPAKFYFAWEDLYAPTGSDFTDVVVSVEGAECSGGGADCQTTDGAKGPCAQGTMACKSGALTCLPHVTASAEKCNGVDDDCNGIIDDNAPCPASQVCYHGQCQASCASGEFPCQASKQCDPASGLCLDPACVGQQCAADQTCIAGVCAAPCVGVVCPKGQLCLGNECVDLCHDVSCTGGQVCVNGACTAGCMACGGLGCSAPEQCDETSGKCSDPSCAKPCDAGYQCSAGACVDTCALTNAHCPGGAACKAGVCASAPTNDSGVSSAGSSGLLDFDAGTPSALPADGSQASGSNDGTPRRPSVASSAPGCACSVPGPSPRRTPSAWLLVSAGLCVFLGRRRRNSWHAPKRSSLTLPKVTKCSSGW